MPMASTFLSGSDTNFGQSFQMIYIINNRICQIKSALLNHGSENENVCFDLPFLMAVIGVVIKIIAILFLL